MKIDIKVSLETDGDYSLNNNTDYHMEYDGSGGYYHYFTFTPDTPAYNFEDEHDIEMSPSWRACTMLEKMLCNIHIHYTHYYILLDLYNMFEEAMTAIGKGLQQFETSISGNYEGTFIEVYCTGKDINY